MESGDAAMALVVLTDACAPAEIWDEAPRRTLEHKKNTLLKTLQQVSVAHTPEKVSCDFPKYTSDVFVKPFNGAELCSELHLTLTLE